ncbi:MAG: efflux RND transporter periplasmic adaptor subunit [Lautropia sp.]|nr:efflux RND transporter periplasmic adaptor subunit [Lautropia sp.]
MSIHDEGAPVAVRPRRGKWRPLVLSVVVVAGAAWFGWHGYSSKTTAEPVQTADVRPRVSTAIAAPATVVPVIRLSGTLVAREDIAIGTALQDQRVSEVHVDVGDTVQHGQVLARLEAEQVQAQLQQAEAMLARARASLRSSRAQAVEARASLERIGPLVHTGSVSRQQFDEQRARTASAEASLRAARAEVAQAQAQVRDGRNQRGKAEILAPADGVIAARTARTGTLAGSEPLFRLIRDGRIELDADATSEALGQIRPGQRVWVQVDTGEPLAGVVRLVSPEVDSRSRLGKVRVALPEAAALRVGAYAEAHFQGAEQRLSLVVPTRAVSTTADGGTVVMCVDEDGRVSRQPVKTGRRQGKTLEIISGLVQGQRVVRDAVAFVREGDVVRIAETTVGENEP